MIFAHTWERVLTGEKTQTRRLVKQQTVPSHDGKEGNTDGEWLYTPPGGKPTVFFSKPCKPGTGFWGLPYTPARAKWVVGRTYAVQPGRGKKQVGRILLTEIRREDVREISFDDVRREGFVSKVQFFEVWMQMHDKEAWEWWCDADDYAQDRKYFNDGSSRSLIYDYLPNRPSHLYDAWVLCFELVQS